MTGEFILSATGAPFGDPITADIKRRMLVEELGVGDDAFVVVPHPEGGYAVVRGDAGDGRALAPASEPVPDWLPKGPGDDAQTPQTRRPSSSAGTGTATDTETALGTGAVSNTGLIEPDADHPYPPAFVLNVSPRAFVDRYALVAAGVLLVSMPWGAVFPSVAPGTLGGQVAWLLRLCGLVLAFWNMARFVYSYLFFAYEITAEDARARRGPLLRSARKVPFTHVHVTTVRQSLWERLLGVGAVRVHTSDGDRPALSISRIANPARLAETVQARCEAVRLQPPRPAH